MMNPLLFPYLDQNNNIINFNMCKFITHQQLTLNLIYSEFYFARFLHLHDAVAPKDSKDPVTSYFNFLFLRHESVVGGDKSDISSGENLGKAIWRWCLEIRSVSLNLDVCASALVCVLCVCECGRIHRSIERYISLTTLPPVATRLLTRPKYQPARTAMFRDTWTPRGPLSAHETRLVAPRAFIASAFSLAR